MNNVGSILEDTTIFLCRMRLAMRHPRERAVERLRPLLCVAFIAAVLACHAGSACAQVTCTANAGIPETVRFEGVAEKVGDIVLSCTGTASGPISANIQLFLATNITNNVQGDTTDALLMLDEPPPASQQLNVNIFRGRRTASNAVVWTGIPLAPAAGPVNRIVRLTNVRANANGVAPPGPVPSQIQALVSMTSSVPVGVINPTPVVAFVALGMDFLVTGLAGAPAQFPMTFSENSVSSFRKRIEVDAAGNPVQQNIPGNIYSTESGFTSGATGEAGKATTGTRLVARFTNVPEGITLSVPTLLPSSTSLLLARLTRKTGIVPLTSGAGFAAWEVIGGAGITGSLTMDSFVMPVTVSFAPGVPGLGPTTVTGRLGPFSSVSAAATSLGAVPRFADPAPELWTYAGLFRSGSWSLDVTRNGVWDGPAADRRFFFGAPGDVPVAGDWNGDGTTEAGVFRAGRFILDVNGNGAFDPGVDRAFTFGLPTDLPVAGDWDGDGTTEAGVFRAGRFILDVNGNGAFTPGVDRAFTFGLPTDLPVTGDWNGDGTTEAGVFRAGRFILDMDGNGVFNPGVDRAFTFGLATDLPVAGDWNGDGITEVGVFRAGRFILDVNNNGSFDPGVDRAFTFGLATDLPVTGVW